MIVNHLKNGIQQFMGECHEAACCALCLIDIAQEYRYQHKEKYPEPDLDVMKCLYNAVDRGFIYFNENDLNDNNNMYVKHPAEWLELMTGKKWTYRHEEPLYRQKKNEYVMQRYERKRTGYTVGHFQRDKVFEPIKDSVTVKYGVLVSTRVCTVKE